VHEQNECTDASVPALRTLNFGNNGFGSLRKRHL